MGYAYAADSLIGFLSYTHIAIHTALGFLVLACGVLFRLRDRGFTGIVMSDTPGGAMARHLLPAVIAVPVVFGWLRVMGERAGLYGDEFGVALMVTASIVTLVIVVGWSASTLDKADAERKRAEEALRRAGEYNRSLLEASLDPLVTIGPDGTVTDVNAATESVTGYSQGGARRDGFLGLLHGSGEGPRGVPAGVPGGRRAGLRADGPAAGREHDSGPVQRLGVPGRFGKGRRGVRGRAGRHGAEAGGRGAEAPGGGAGPFQRGTGKIRLRGLPRPAGAPADDLRASPSCWRGDTRGSSVPRPTNSSATWWTGRTGCSG